MTYARRNPGLIEFMIDKNMERAARVASRVDIPVSDMHDLRSADAAGHLNLNHFEQRADYERHGAVESPEAPGLRDRLLAVQLSLVVDPEAVQRFACGRSELSHLDEKVPHHFHWKALAAALDPLDLNDADTGNVPYINTGNAPFYPQTPIEILLCCMLIAVSFFMITYHTEWRASCTANRHHWQLQGKLVDLKSCWQLIEVRLFQGIYETEHTRNNEVTNIKLTGDKVVAARLSGRIDFLRLETYTQGRQFDWGFTSAYRRTHFPAHIRTGSAGSLSMFQQPNGPANVHHGHQLQFTLHGHRGPSSCRGPFEPPKPSWM
ncbi:sterol regulatory element binding protein cleavage-activating protein [Culex quinquefasciatus]|uniref:Sterol regulatory element binding protein cleavage-activating protein n=1 Tax=Culex quinquefasciatus TaxID=7176 RepID=B0XDR1_CULQU|nr:sterol regulatory element binding protein cleavage-activating protein [Culex quinquefasciatus]|eukprot:XP_001867783.1 sterol regulatory element binding protein cleavage-activating protein [Culex quinquefasciatus]